MNRNNLGQIEFGDYRYPVETTHTNVPVLQNRQNPNSTSTQLVHGEENISRDNLPPQTDPVAALQISTLPISPQPNETSATTWPEDPNSNLSPTKSGWTAERTRIRGLGEGFGRIENIVTRAEQRGIEYLHALAPNAEVGERFRGGNPADMESHPRLDVIASRRISGSTFADPSSIEPANAPLPTADLNNNNGALAVSVVAYISSAGRQSDSVPETTQTGPNNQTPSSGLEIFSTSLGTACASARDHVISNVHNREMPPISQRPREQSDSGSLDSDEEILLFNGRESRGNFLAPHTRP